MTSNSTKRDRKTGVGGYLGARGRRVRGRGPHGKEATYVKTSGGYISDHAVYVVYNHNRGKI
jgi:hypothetical protein